MKFCTDVNGPQRMNPNDLSDVPLVPPVGQSFHLSCKISSHLLDVLAQTFLADIHGLKTMCYTNFSFSSIMTLTFVVLSDISQHEVKYTHSYPPQDEL